jgi:hypothetical protein
MLAQPFTKSSSTVWFTSVELFGPDIRPKMEFASRDVICFYYVNARYSPVLHDITVRLGVVLTCVTAFSEQAILGRTDNAH